jgi:hypothetical protein
MNLPRAAVFSRGAVAVAFPARLLFHRIPLSTEVAIRRCMRRILLVSSGFAFVIRAIGPFRVQLLGSPPEDHLAQLFDRSISSL